MKTSEHLTKADRTRQFIIEKTAPIFNTKGYAGTSMSDITEVTGLTKGSIYGNFENKDEVALAVFDYNLRRVNSIMKAEINAAETYKDKLLGYTRVYQNFKTGPFPEGGCPLLNTAVEADDTHKELRKKAAEAVLRWKNNITALIEKGIAAGEFRKGVQPEQTAVTMIALIEGGIMISKLMNKGSYLGDIVKSCEKLIDDLS